LSSFVWGSNSDIIDWQSFLPMPSDKRREKVSRCTIETTDYILAKMLRLFLCDRLRIKAGNEPSFQVSCIRRYPGTIFPDGFAGGPNANLNDEKSDSNPNGVTYSSREPAQCYMDLTESYASNEIAINWNAPLAYITGFLASYSARPDKNSYFKRIPYGK
jgi:hypothetical protein